MTWAKLMILFFTLIRKNQDLIIKFHNSRDPDSLMTKKSKFTDGKTVFHPSLRICFSFSMNPDPMLDQIKNPTFNFFSLAILKYVLVAFVFGSA